MNNVDFNLVYNAISFAIAAFGASSIFFLLQRSQVSPAYKTALTLSSLVCLITTYHYLRIFESFNNAYLLKDGSTLKGKTDNTWSEFKLEDIPLVGDTLSKASKLGEKIITGFGFENTGNYSETKKRSVVIEFPLYNTMDIGDTIKNYEFISLFGMQNLKIRTSFLTYIPPKIYSVESTGRGGVYMPAAYVSSYDVRSIGATREIQIGGNTHLIPEAYKVSITLTELIQESANIMQGSLGGSKTQLIGNYKGTMESIAKGPTEQVSEALNTEVIKTAFKAANTAVAGGFNAITKLF